MRFSAQPRADGDEALDSGEDLYERCAVSVLNREPMGMKRSSRSRRLVDSLVSVLNREPMGMKPSIVVGSLFRPGGFSAQPRADGDEAFVAGKRTITAY